MSGDTAGAGPIIPATLTDQARADNAQPAAPGAAPAAPVNWTGDARELLDLALVLLVPLSPSLATVYPDAVRARLAEHVGQVFKKYDVDIVALFGKWAPEFGLAMAALPLVAPTVAAIRTDRAARAATDGAKPAEQPAGAAPVQAAEKPAGAPDLDRFPGAASAAEKTNTNPIAASS